MNAWLLAFCCLLAALPCQAQTPAKAQARGVALVIGNAAYADRALPNPGNDAADVAQLLREAGFEVLARGNLTESAMKEALADFEDRLRASRGVGVFYFAGHGMQTSRGRNFLLPVGRSYTRERDVELFGVPADAVLASMEKVGNALNIVILDACRDAPLPPETRSAISRGLARMDAPSGSLIAFATAPGRTASDNPGRRNGLYTQHLLRVLRQPGLRLEDVFKEVGRAVERDSGGQQSPEEFMKLRDPAPFCLFPGRGCGAGAGPRLASADEVEQEFWDAIKTSRDARDHRDYLQRYPNGRFAVLAQRQLRLLDDSAARAPAAVVAAAPLAVPAPMTARPPAMEKVSLTAELQLNTGLTTFLPDSSAKLDNLAAQAKRVTLEVIIAVGHASPDEGPADVAQRLSVRRAEAAKAHLVSQGIEPNRIYTEGRGASQPTADNSTAEGRAKNRRVELELVGTRPKP